MKIERSKITKNNNKINFLLITILTIFLFISFYKGVYTNALANSFDNNFTNSFESFQKDSDSIVISSLIYNKQFRNNNGVMTVLQDEGISTSSIFEGYKNDVKFSENNFKEYTSQTGLHTMVYTFFDNVLPFSNSLKLDFYYGINAFLSSIILAIFVAWISKKTSWLVGLGLILYISVYDVWIIQFAKSIYWVMWTWFLPMIISIFLLERYSETKVYSYTTSFVLICAAIILKCLCGFEYITTIMISLTVPYFFYWVTMKWKLIEGVKKLLVVSFGALSGFIISLGIYIIQYSVHYNSISKAIKQLSITAFKRIPGNTDVLKDILASGVSADTIDIYKKSLEVSPMSVVWTYMTKTFEPIFGPILGPVPYGHFIWFILIVSVLSIGLLCSRILSKKVKLNIIGLVIATFVAFIAPISWYALAKGHSYIHTHINFILWDLPFLLFGISMSIYVLSIFLVYITKWDKLSTILFKYNITNDSKRKGDSL